MKKVALLWLAVVGLAFGAGLECKVEEGKIKAMLTLERTDADRKVTFLWTSPKGVSDNRNYEKTLPAGHARIWDWRNPAWRKGTHEVQIMIDGEASEYRCTLEVE